jgi:hypothetical protein
MLFRTVVWSHLSWTKDGVKTNRRSVSTAFGINWWAGSVCNRPYNSAVRIVFELLYSGKLVLADSAGV